VTSSSIKVKKSWLGKLDFLALSKNAWIYPDQDRIYIERAWVFGVTDQKSLKISGLEEVDANQSTLFRQLFNFGTLTLKGQGVTESILFVRDPHFYRAYLTKIK
jgi:hypothetical protein